VSLLGRTLGCEIAGIGRRRRATLGVSLRRARGALAKLARGRSMATVSKDSGGDAEQRVRRALGAVVRWRRRARGPKRPSWDHAFETWVTLIRTYGRRSTVLPLSVQRRAAAALVPSAPPPSMRYERVDAGGVPAEWFRSEGSDESRVLLYLHGGGYSIGSIDVHREPVSRLCQAAGARTLVPEYRLAPEHPFPSQLEDAVAAYQWLLDQGIRPARIVVAGESAGAGLVLSMLVALRDSLVPLPAAAVCISPWVDLEMRGQSMVDNAPYDYVSREVLHAYVRRFVGKHDVRNPLAAPIHADLRGLPPLLVLAGGAEVLLDDARAIAERAGRAGVRVTLEIEPDMIHAWTLFGREHPRCQAGVERVGDFVRQSLSPRTAPAAPARRVRRVS
jgi:monoterpene epsilon-lactone hydrolase